MDTPKFPFDEADAPAGKDAEQGTPSSATGMFATPPPKDSDPVASLFESLGNTSPSLEVPASRPTPSPAGMPTPQSPAPESAPGEFTQMYRAMPFSTVPAPDAVEARIEATPSPLAPQPKKQPPGDFTRVFTQLPTPQMPARPTAATAPPAPTPPVEVPTAPPPAHVPGEFTQMFQGLGNSAEMLKPSRHSPPELRLGEPEKTVMEPASKAAHAEGSFTQLFQAISGSTPEPEKQKKETLPPIPSNPDAFRSSQAKPLQEPATRPAVNKEADDFWANASNAPRPAAVPATPQPPASQGGFTQLFETLSEDRQAQQPLPSPSSDSGFRSQARPEPPLQTGPGDFTRLVQSLEEPAAPQSAPAFATRPPLPSQQQGPGEYTRVISNAMVREAQSQPGAGGPPFPTSAPPPAPAMPQRPAFPVFSPPAAQPPQRPAIPAGPAFQPPSAFPPPQAPVPAPAPTSKLQQYLPLILVVNIFVLLVVVLVVIFALRRH